MNTINITELYILTWLNYVNAYFTTVWGFPGGSVGKNLPAMQETQFPSLGQEDPLEEGIATHYNILAWRISWIEEPGRLQSIGCKQSDTTEATEH